MKLGKLLAAGKSVMNGREAISYRSNKQIYLPKFGSEKNPFKPQPASETEIAAGGEGSVPGSPAEVMNPRPTRAAGVEARAATLHELDTKAARGDARPTENARVARLSPLPSALHFDAAGRSDARGQDRPTGFGQGSTESRSTEDIGEARGDPALPEATARQAARPTEENASAAKKKSRWMSKWNPVSIFRGEAVRDPAKAGVSRGPVPARQTELSLDSVKVVHNDLSDVDVEVVPIKSRPVPAELPAAKKSWEFLGERLFGVETR